MVQNKSYQPHLSFIQILNMSVGFFGIQFGFALQNANTSWIFSSLNATPEELPMLWIAAPVTGLLVQPIIGYYSDRTWHPTWGRRRPYFTIGALLAMTALILMPNSSVLWMAAGTLWIMDASLNISMEPFRAFVGDMLPPAQRALGFAMQAVFIGTGAVVASSLPWIFTTFFEVSNVPDGSAISDAVRYSFYVGGVVLFVSVMYTVFTTKEYPPTETAEQRIKNRETQSTVNHSFHKQRFLYTGISLLSLGLIGAVLIYMTGVVQDLYVLAGAFVVFGIIHLVAAILIGARLPHVAVVNMIRDFHEMPGTMRQLAVVQFFSWFALFAMWIFTTSAVTSHIFGATDPKSEAYGAGAVLVGNLFSVYNGIAAVAAIFLPVLSRSLGTKATHLVSLTCGGLGLISFYFAPGPEWLWLSMVGVGIAWASILSMPYAILSVALPPDKMGYYMGVFNFFIVIPQIIAAACLGAILKGFFNNQSIYVLILGGSCMILAGLLTLRVKLDGK
ncbi:MAG TPA: MFS transporter [Cyclobacteriaceae bacterium]|nr:MFS transporter [Cyclobacteriaceae bacterium]